jgi:hypothetical protein
MQETRAFWNARLDNLEAVLRAEDAIEKARKPSPSPKKRRSK